MYKKRSSCCTKSLIRSMTAAGGLSFPSTATSRTASSLTYVLQYLASSCSDMLLICRNGYHSDNLA